MRDEHSAAHASAGPILVAVDFSPHSEAALAWAADEARLHGRHLVVLHVVHDPMDAPGYYRVLRKLGGGDAAAVAERLEEAASQLLQEFLARARERHTAVADLDRIDTRLVVGVPSTRILEVAAELGAWRIVVGSRGRTGLSHVLLGSKAQRVAQLSPVPVTIVKTPRPPAPREDEEDDDAR